MTDRAAIAAKYDHLETEAGGLASPDCDPAAICQRVAEELRIPVECVRAVMRDVLTAQGAG